MINDRWIVCVAGFLLLSVLPAVSYGFCGEERAADSADRMLEKVVVTAPAKTRIELLPLNVTVIGDSVLRESCESSLLPVLTSRVAGLFTTERGFAGYGVSGGSAGMVNIRGVGQGNKVLFMIDGQPQWAAVFGHALPDTYVANGVERVEVVKGPSSLLYGSNAMGGSVNIITRRATREGLYGRGRAMFGSYNTQRMGLSAGYKKGDIGVELSGQLDRSNGNRAGSSYWLANEVASISYGAEGHWSGGCVVDLTQTRANNPGTLQSPLESMWTYMSRGAASVYVRNGYAKSEGGIQGFINWGRHNVDDGHAPDAAPRDYLFHSTDYNMGATLYQTMHWWSGSDLSVGIDFTHWGGHTWNTLKASPESVTEGVRKSENETGCYVMLQQGLFGNHLDINGGLRLQHSSQYGNEWVPQAGFIFRAPTSTTVKFSWGKGFRAPNLRELYMYAPHNPELEPERLYNYEIELRQQIKGGMAEIGVSFYYIDGSNMIQTEPVNGKPLNVNTGSFINKGFEVEAACRLSRQWQVCANYAYLHTDNSRLLSAPKNKMWCEVGYHNGAWTAAGSVTGIWSLQTGGPEKSDYALVNFRGSYTACKGEVKVQPFMKLDNIFNKHYEILYGCPMPGISILGGVEIAF